MTVEKLHIAFDIELDKTLDFEYPYISPEQKDYWLNKAQERFVKQRMFGNNLYKTTFEETEKRIDDLRTIVKKESIVPTVTGQIYLRPLPNDYLYLVRHQCTTVSPLCGTKVVGGLQVKNDEINTLKKNPFERPTNEEPLYYIEGNNIVYELVDNSFTIADSNITYVKIPRPITNGSEYIVSEAVSECELPEHTHGEILDIAIAMTLENIESQRYQTNLNELTKTE